MLRSIALARSSLRSSYHQSFNGSLDIYTYWKPTFTASSDWSVKVFPPLIIPRLLATLNTWYPNNSINFNLKSRYSSDNLMWCLPLVSESHSNSAATVCIAPFDLEGSLWGQVHRGLRVFDRQRCEEESLEREDRKGDHRGGRWQWRGLNIGGREFRWG